MSGAVAAQLASVLAAAAVAGIAPPPGPELLERFLTRVETKAGPTRYVASGLLASARAEGETLWQTPLPMKGLPGKIEADKPVLRVTSDRSETLLLRRDTGEFIFRATGKLPAGDAFGQVAALLKLARVTGGRFPHVERHIAALAALEDPRGAPLLIELIDEGFSPTQKALAVAALERLAGAATPWKQAWKQYRADAGIPRNLFLRVRNAERRAAEIRKWRKRFAKTE